MAAGDYVVRRNASNTDTIANTSGDLTAIWDTAVANIGSGITHSSGVFTLGETGHFLIIWSDRITISDTANERISWESRINFAGSDILAGSCTGYIRKNNQTQSFVVGGVAVINVTTTTGNGDEFFIHHVRDDDTTAVGLPTRVGNNMSGVTIIKLDDTWGYGLYSSAAATTASATDNVATTLNIQTNDEQDSPFTRSTNSVDMATTNPVLAIYTLRMTTQNGANRSESQGRLNINAGTIEPGSWSQVYGPRNSNAINQASMSHMCLLHPASGDDVTLEIVSRELGGDDWDCVLQLIELPAGAETITVEATGGNFHPGTSAVFAWDTLEQIDTAAFTHIAGNANIDVDNAGDYLVMAGQAVTSAVGMTVTRAVPSAQFRVNGVNQEMAGGTSYNRSSGTADHDAVRVGGLLTGLSADQSIEIWNTDDISQNTGTLTCEAGGFSVIRLSSLFPVGGDTTIVAAAGAYALTGVAALLEYHQILDAAGSSYALTGQNVDFTFSLPMGVGSYALTGQDLDLMYAGAIIAGIGSYALTGFEISTQHWLAALNAGITVDVNPGDQQVRLRLEIKNVGTVPAPSQSFQYRYSKNSGAYADLTAVSDNVRTFLTSHFADGDDITKQHLGSDPFLANNNAAEEGTGAFSMGESFIASNVIETEVALEFVKADLADTDTIDIRIYKPGGIAFSSYVQTPRITIISGADETIVAGAGSYSLSGVVADLEYHAAILAGIGAYSLSGVAADLEYHSVVLAAIGSYSLTGADALLEHHQLLAIDPGSYILTGIDALLEYHQLLAIDTGSYSLTGVAADLEYHALTVAGVGSYTLTGVTADLDYHSAVLAAIGSYSLTGVDALLEYHQLLAIDAGAYTLTGQDIDLRTGFSLIAGIGSYSLTGIDANLEYHQLLAIDAGSYSLTGIDANLEYHSAVLAGIGSYSLTGIDADLLTGIRIAVDSGAYTLTGIDALLEHHQLLAINAGSYLLVGQDAGLDAIRVVLAGIGSYALTGVDATLTYSAAVIAVVGSYSLTGIDASLLYDSSVIAGIGSYSLTGIDADLLVGLSLTIDAGSYSLTGVAADLEYHSIVLAGIGSYNLTGIDANLEAHYVTVAGVGAYTLTGFDVTFPAGSSLVADSGSYTLTGVSANLLAQYLTLLGSGSYIISGVNASLTYDAVISIGVGTYALVGQDLSTDLSTPADPGSYILTGQDAGVLATLNITIGSGSYVLTGFDLDFLLTVVATILVEGDFILNQLQAADFNISQIEDASSLIMQVDDKVFSISQLKKEDFTATQLADEDSILS